MNRCRRCGATASSRTFGCSGCRPPHDSAPPAVNAARVLVALGGIGSLLAGLFGVIGGLWAVQVASSIPDTYGSDGTPASPYGDTTFAQAGGTLLVLGFVVLAVAVAQLVNSVRLGRADRRARATISALTVADAVLTVVYAAAVEPSYASVLVIQLPLGGLLMWLLWWTESSQRFFGDSGTTASPTWPASPPPGPGSSSAPETEDIRSESASTVSVPTGNASPGIEAGDVRLAPAAIFAFATLFVLLWSVSTGEYLSGGLIRFPGLILTAVLAVTALGLARGRRLARAGGALLAPLLLLLAPVGGSHSALLVVGGLLASGAVGAAALVPALRRHFDEDRPTLAPSVALARMVLTTFAVTATLGVVVTLVVVVAGVLGVSRLVGRASEGTDAAASLGFLGLVGQGLVGAAVVLVVLGGALAALGFWARSALGRRSSGARLTVSVVAGFASLFFLVVSVAGAGGASLLALGLNLALLVLLWVPSDARMFFGDAPLTAVEDLCSSVRGATSARRSGPARPWPTTPWPPADRSRPGRPDGPPPGAPWPTAPGPRPTGSRPTGSRPTGSRPTTRSVPPPSPPWGTSVPGGPRSPSEPAASPGRTTPSAPGLDAETVEVSGRAAPGRREPVGAENVIPRACTHCGKRAEQAWSHCPACGVRLGAAARERHP